MDWTLEPGPPFLFSLIILQMQHLKIVLYKALLVAIKSSYRFEGCNIKGEYGIVEYAIKDSC
jgi:hypothetical protein